MRTIPRSRVAPFGIRRLIARLQLPVDVSPLSASFFGSWPLRHPPNTPPCLAVPFPFVHLHTAHGRPYGKPQNVRSHAYMASCFGPPTTGEWVQNPQFITSLACDRFASHSARIGKIATITLCVWKSALKNSSLDNWRVGNSVGDKP